MEHKFIAALAILTSILFLNGCHTAQGFGQDLEAGGKEIQKAANTGDSSSRKSSQVKTSSTNQSPTTTTTRTTTQTTSSASTSGY